jgi:phosphoribosylaminoimidazolecarboxamide formyltransferase/IMP cyclohydrolase
VVETASKGCVTDEFVSGAPATSAVAASTKTPVVVRAEQVEDVLASVSAKVRDVVPVKTALVSVFDKAGLEELGPFLAKQGIHVLSTGGTAAKLRELGCTVQDVADYTGSPEILDGRVKTLHPKVHGGLLAVRGEPKHENEMSENGIRPIDLVVANLYPFNQAVKKGGDFLTCIENIDIGGPAMIRASAKNHAAVAVVTSPAQYKALMEQMSANSGGTNYDFRKNLAAEAYALTAAYDASTSSWLAGQVSSPPTSQSVAFNVERSLKYGTNPHQLPAAVCSVGGQQLPFEVLSGTPGYINLLDAVNAWQLVHELAQATGLPAAASFKHVSPAGAAIGVPLSELEQTVYEVKGKELTATAAAYVRARNADPLCSYGDFVAISHKVDLATANLLKIEVSDGIIAPGFHDGALEILQAKKKGKFIVLKADTSFEPPENEYRMIGGVGFVQKRNDALFDASKLDNIVTKNKDLPEAAKKDLVLASIAIKYTQSNSVGYAKDGMMLGVGAGQQSRVDCVKLAGRKVATWRLRFHPKVRSLPFKEGVKRQARVNARVRYIEGDMQESELKEWQKNFDGPVEPLTEAERSAFLGELDGVSISSDAFFPFRDSIDYAAKFGVKYIAEPGGSVADEDVVAACDTYGMVTAFTNLRLFHH